MTPAPYRTPTPPDAPRVRRRWVVRDVHTMESTAVMLVVLACSIVASFVVFDTAPIVQRALLVWALFVAAWCAAFVRREVVS